MLKQKGVQQLGSYDDCLYLWTQKREQEDQATHGSKIRIRRSVIHCYRSIYDYERPHHPDAETVVFLQNKNLYVFEKYDWITTRLDQIDDFNYIELTSARDKW